MSEERRGDMTSASLPAGGEPGALHLHLWTHSWPTENGVERPERRCDPCGAVERWVAFDDGHAGGYPHFCDGSGDFGWNTTTKRLKDGRVTNVSQGTLFDE